MIKNVVIVSDTVDVIGGTVRVAVDTAVLMAKKGLNVYFFAGSGHVTDNSRLAEDPNIKVTSLGLTLLKDNPNRLQAAIQGMYNFKAARELKKLLSGLDSTETAVHVHTWHKILSLSIFSVIADMGFPLFLTGHDYLLACPAHFFFNYHSDSVCELAPMSIKCFFSNCDKRGYPYKVFRFIRSILLRKTVRNVIRGSIGYIFISEFSRKQFLRRMPVPVNSFFVRNPIYFKDRFRIEAEKNSAFLFIGRLDTEKGITHFCQAVRNTGVKGIVVGDGDLKSELEAQYPEITFTGWQDKEGILLYMKQARCLIFPSLCYESSPLTPLEVNAYGIPVIASDCSAASENAAFVYRSDAELEHFIRQVASQDIRQLSIDTYNNFDESLTDNYADELLKVYSTPLKTV